MTGVKKDLYLLNEDCFMSVEKDFQVKNKQTKRVFFLAQEMTSGWTFHFYSRYVTQCFHNPMQLHKALMMEGGGTWPLHYP